LGFKELGLLQPQFLLSCQPFLLLLLVSFSLPLQAFSFPPLPPLILLLLQVLQESSSSLQVFSLALEH